MVEFYKIIPVFNFKEGEDKTTELQLPVQIRMLSLTTEIL